MNKKAYTTAITLIGKLATEFKFMDDPSDMGLALTDEEIALVLQALEEYRFYHAHEAKPSVEARLIGKPARASTGK